MLSVTIPTRNRSALPRLASDSLRGPNLPSRGREVVVIDNESTDDPSEAVESFRSRFAEREARGDVLVCADDDIQAPPTRLQATEECLRRSDVALVGANKLEGTRPRWRRREE
jgi:glycosyltransferase involved in cell wall biosynthesis